MSCLSAQIHAGLCHASNVWPAVSRELQLPLLNLSRLNTFKQSETATSCLKKQTSLVLPQRLKKHPPVLRSGFFFFVRCPAGSCCNSGQEASRAAKDWKLKTVKRNSIHEQGKRFLYYRQIRSPRRFSRPVWIKCLLGEHCHLVVYKPNSSSPSANSTLSSCPLSLQPQISPRFAFQVLRPTTSKPQDPSPDIFPVPPPSGLSGFTPKHALSWYRHSWGFLQWKQCFQRQELQCLTVIVK